MHRKKELIQSNWKLKIHEIIFEADTTTGKYFDVFLILSIICSIIIVMLDSVSALNKLYGSYFNALEWFFTILFTFEYILRLLTVGRPLGYASSFYGIIDLMAIIPTYLSILFPGSHYLVVIRGLRVLRLFRVLKLVQYIDEANLLIKALIASRRKITVFLLTVSTLVIILGSIMYVIEDPEYGFTSIPKSIYWAVVTLTTVGYGDISPQTNLGQTLAALIMILGYGIIAIPTGIVTVEMAHSYQQNTSTQVCQNCCKEGHDHDASYCKCCGARLS